MYSILINKKDYLAKTLEVTVFVFTYDFKTKTHLPLPQHASFFLDFLVNGNEIIDNSIKVLLGDYKLNDSFLSAYTNQFIEKVELAQTDNYPLTKWQQKYHNKKTDKNKDYSQLVQGTYIIHLVDELYMDDFHKDFHYTGIFRDIATIEDNILAKYNLPNTQQHIQEIGKLTKSNLKTAQQVKISNNNDNIFFAANENELSIIDTSSWTFQCNFSIEDAHYKIRQDSKNNIIWLQDYDEIIAAFDLNTQEKIKYTNNVSYYMSADLNLMCNWEENEPINIKNNQGNILFSIPNKEEIFYNLAFCPNDKLIAISYAKCIDIWDIEKQTLFKSISFEKGVLQKLIFGHDSSVIYALAENIIYGITIEESLIIFQFTVDNKNYTIKDFDISDKYFAILKLPNIVRSYIYDCCYIYEVNTTQFSINIQTLDKLKTKAKNNRIASEERAKLLIKMPYNKNTSCYIDELKCDLSSIYGWNNLSIALFKEKSFDLALDINKILHAMRPDDKDFIFSLGTNYKYLQDYENAIFYLKKCIKMDPQYAPAYANLSLTLSYIGEYQEALNLVEKVITLEPSNNRNYTNLSIIHLNNKNIQAARTAAISGISKGNLDQCSMNLAHTYYIQNDIGTARNHYRTSLKNFKNTADFFNDMTDDYKVLSLYNIDKEIWLSFVEELKAVSV